MKSPLSSTLLSAAVLAVFGAAAVHAAERAPELPDLTFRSVTHSDVEAPAVSGKIAYGLVTPKEAACPVLSLSGAKIANKSAFDTDKEVLVDGSKVGAIDSDNGEYVYKDALGNVAAKKTADGTVTDCSGKKIGSIEEQYTDQASAFTLKDAQGQVVAKTGAFDDIGFAFVGSGGKNVAVIDKDHWYSDTVTLSISSGIDPRLVAIASAQNTTSVYKRARQRRIENGGGHGRI